MYTQERIKRTEQLTKMAKILKIHLYSAKSKKKKDVEGSSLGLQRGGKQFSGGCKSKYLANKCLLAQAEKMGPRKEF